MRVIEPDSMAFRGSYVASEVDFRKIEENTKRIEEERKSSAAEYLKQVLSRIKQNRVKLETEVLVGRVADSLVDYTESKNIDLILIATHGRSGVSRWVRGSVADRILRASRVPVLIIRAPGTISEHKD